MIHTTTNGLVKVSGHILSLDMPLTVALDTAFKPQVEQGIIRLLHPGTWSIIDR
jgi:uncharacterized protein YceK